MKSSGYFIHSFTSNSDCRTNKSNHRASKHNNQEGQITPHPLRGMVKLYHIHEYYARKDFIHRNLNTDYYDGNSKLQHQTFTKRNRGTEK